MLPISHDEVVHGKGSLLGKIPGSRPDQLATLRAFLAYMWSHPGKQLLFMGSEFAQPGEWADGRSLDWWLLDHAAHYRVHNLVKELNALYRAHPALWALDHEPAGFRWLDADDNTGNLLSYLRFSEADPRRGDVVATVVNYSGEDRAWVRIGVPRPGRWEVVLDTSGFDETGSPSQAGRRARGRRRAVERPAVVGDGAGGPALGGLPRPGRRDRAGPGGGGLPPGRGRDRAGGGRGAAPSPLDLRRRTARRGG